MRVALFAADDFTLPICRFLAESGKFVCLVTQPDRQRGRGRKISSLPVKDEACCFDIPVLSAEKLTDESFINEFKSFDIDIPIVSAFGQFIPKWIREWYPWPCINVHPSILPRWRGPDPIRNTILAGDTQTGVTLHFTEKKMDTGDIITVSEIIDVGENVTHFELRNILSDVAVELVSDFITRIEKAPESTDLTGRERICGLFDCRKQNDNDVTYAGKLDKTEMWINWDLSAVQIHNLIRALSPEPGAKCGNTETPFRILRSETYRIEEHSNVPGEIVSDPPELMIACGDGILRITEIQPAGKRIMDACDFLNGYRLKKGDNIKNI